MSENLKIVVKKYWPIGVGAIVVIYLYEKAKNNNGAVTASPDTSGLLALQEQQQAAQIGLSQQAQQAAIDNANQQNVIQYTAALGSAAESVGSAIASIYTSEGQLPAAAIQAASNQNQVALASAANIAAAGVSALPGYLNAASNLTAASYLPIASYASGIKGIVGGVGDNSAQVMNAVSQSGASSTSSAAQAAGSAAQANAQSSGSEMQAIGSIASIAMLLLL